MTGEAYRRFATFPPAAPLRALDSQESFGATFIGRIAPADGRPKAGRSASADRRIRLFDAL